ncbi:unnamed protein product [Ilex paraguariensis]|uniref:Uncharacterized protein n=1 Tax=Ilex paraguariensis TaxID=185542 RepID=A0ABC8TDS8_9AQUA
MLFQFTCNSCNLTQVATWLELKDRLMPNGRLMVNCGSANDGTSNSIGATHAAISSSDDTWEQNSTIKALCKAFPGQNGINNTDDLETSNTSGDQGKAISLCAYVLIVRLVLIDLDKAHKLTSTQLSWKKLPKRAGENYLTLTGSLPDLTMWAAALPDQFSSSVRQWRTCWLS